MRQLYLMATELLQLNDDYFTIEIQGTNVPGMRGDEVMKNNNYDEKLLKMLNDDTREIISKTLKEFLKQIHKER